jgi:hypothetical protein
MARMLAGGVVSAVVVAAGHRPGLLGSWPLAASADRRVAAASSSTATRRTT